MEPIKNEAFVFNMGLVDTANRPNLLTNPTIQASDFQISTDNASLTNLTNTPTVNPAGTNIVNVVLTQAEMNGDNIMLVIADVVGGEWDACYVVINTTSQGIDDLAPAATALSNATWTAEKATYLDETISSRIPAVGGNVEVSGYSPGQSPADLILTTPANKILSNASGQVVSASVQGNVTGSVASISGNIGGDIIGDVRGKILGNTASTIVGVGARVVDDSGAAIAPAATALSNATWTNAKAAYLDAAVSSRMASGNVTVGAYAAGLDPATYILSTPANKLKTDANNRVEVSNVIGDVQGKVLGSGASAITGTGAQVQLEDDAISDEKFYSPRGKVVADADNSSIAFKTDLASSITDTYKDLLCKFTSGLLTYQVKKVVSYIGTDKTIVVETAFTTTPTADDEFDLINR